MVLSWVNLISVGVPIASIGIIGCGVPTGIE
jgi:hypothetical protein